MVQIGKEHCFSQSFLSRTQKKKPKLRMYGIENEYLNDKHPSHIVGPSLFILFRYRRDFLQLHNILTQLSYTSVVYAIRMCCLLREIDYMDCITN